MCQIVRKFPSVTCWALAVFVLSLFYVSSSWADSKSSMLFPPTNLGLYDKNFWDLTDSQKWRRRIFGLRNVQLHPSTWGVRKSERTENRRIIPIKYFWLRSSESSDYRLGKIVCKFRFGGTKKTNLRSNPHLNDPVLEIGFNSEFELAQLGERPEMDRGYALRISAFPKLESGLFYRSQEMYKKVFGTSPPIISIAHEHELEIVLNEKFISGTLDGAPWLSGPLLNANKGMIYIIGSWHPIAVSKLEFHGTKLENGRRVSVIDSGIVDVPRPQKANK